MQEWVWIATGALGLGALVQEARIYKIRRDWRNQEEIFQVVTENAADMIALVDVKGHRLYNSPSYKRILGYSPAELSETSSFEQIHPEDRMRVLEAARDVDEHLVSGLRSHRFIEDFEVIDIHQQERVVAVRLAPRSSKCRLQAVEKHPAIW